MEWKQTMTTSISFVLGEEIKKAFEQADPYETRAAFILSSLSLKPIEELLFKKYKIWTGDGRLRFPPLAVIRSMLLKELKGINSYQQLIAYLYAKPEERTLLGFGWFVPSNQTYSIIRRKRIDAETQRQMDFVVDRIYQFVNENGRQLDIDFIPASFRRAEAIQNSKCSSTSACKTHEEGDTAALQLFLFYLQPITTSVTIRKPLMGDGINV